MCVERFELHEQACRYTMIATGLVPVSVETLKHKFLHNVHVIDRLVNEKRELEEKVTDLETTLFCRSFQPWWDYPETKTPRGTPRTPRSARLSREYGKMNGERRGTTSERRLLSAAEAAARLFENEDKKDKDNAKGVSVGLSKHLMADNDRHKQKLGFMDDEEERKRLEQEQYERERQEAKQRALAAQTGPFRGVERRQSQAQEKANQKASARAERESAAKAEEERRREGRGARVNKELGVVVTWDVLQANEEVARRERIEHRKMKLYAESKPPAAAKPLPPRPAPTRPSTIFTAKDIKLVRKRLEQQQQSFENKMISAKLEAAASLVNLKGSGKISNSVGRVSLAEGRRKQRLEAAKTRELTETHKQLMEEKFQLEKILKIAASDLVDGRRLTAATAARMKEALSSSSSATANSSTSGTKENRRQPPSREASRKKFDDDVYQHHTESEGKSKAEAEFSEKSSKERDYDCDYEDRPSSSLASRTRPGKKAPTKPRGPSLMERHSLEVSRQREADLRLGFIMASSD